MFPDREGDCPPSLKKAGGARRDRTDDLMLAKHALYQLSYGPAGAPVERRRSKPCGFAEPKRASAKAGRPGQI